MIPTANTPCTAFEGSTRLATGLLQDVALAAKTSMERGPAHPILVFDDLTSHQIEVDWRGTREDVLRRLVPDALPGAETGPVAPVPASNEPRGPGRPRLGVVAREVTLLPRHWEWLGKQPGGASVALRRLVEEAKRVNDGKDRARLAGEAAYRFMSAMAGNQPGFEEATRALFANNAERFETVTQYWPPDVRDHALALAHRAFGASRSKIV